jgi:hypothetical protein
MMTDLHSGRSRPGSGSGASAGRGPRLRRALGWVLGAAVVGGIAWLISSVLLALTVYTTLSATPWAGAIGTAGAAKLSFEVTNAGTAPANGCLMHVQIGARSIAPAPVPPIKAHASLHVAVAYHLTPAQQARPATVWLQCSGASTAPQRVTPPPNVSLDLRVPAVTADKATRTIRFQVRSHGTAGVASCWAYLSLSSGRTIGAAGQPAVAAGAGGTFTVSYREGTKPVTPEHVWATCLAPSAPRWLIVGGEAAVPAA